MAYYLYQLAFDAPVHFGMAEQGGSLAAAGMSYPSDTLFSALCCELAAAGAEEQLRALIEKCRAGDILLSDLLPYREDEDGEMHYYLPKPIRTVLQRGAAPPENLRSARAQSGARKQMKKISYLRASRLTEYLDAQRAGEVFEERDAFSTYGLTTKVNCRTREPYPFAGISLHAWCGLYAVLYLRDENDAAQMTELFTYLGLSGIGGKRSAGYGRFHLEDDPYDLADAFYEDDAALHTFLENENAPRQMLLSSLLPHEADVGALRGGTYELRKRSGFITPIGAGAVRKKNSVYMLSAGSCLSQRIPGTIVSVDKEPGYEVLRCGKGLYIGVDM